MFNESCLSFLGKNDSFNLKDAFFSSGIYFLEMYTGIWLAVSTAYVLVILIRFRCFPSIGQMMMAYVAIAGIFFSVWFLCVHAFSQQEQCYSFPEMHADTLPIFVGQLAMLAISAVGAADVWKGARQAKLRQIAEESRYRQPIVSSQGSSPRSSRK